MKAKSLFIIFISLIIIANIPLYAAVTSNTTHQQIMQTNIKDLGLIQNQIFTLAQKILFSPSITDTSVNHDLDRINNSIDTINESMSNYSITFSDDSSEKRDVLLLLNSINYIKSSLYELGLLSKQVSSSDKMTTLERYFNYRVYGTNSVRLVANLLSI